MEAIPLSSLLESWERSLRARRRSARTIYLYGLAVIRFVVWLTKRGIADSVPAVGRHELETYLGDTAGEVSPATVALHYRGLRLLELARAEDEVDVNPFAKMRQPNELLMTSSPTETERPNRRAS